MIQSALYVLSGLLILVIASAACYGIGKADGIEQQKKEEQE